MELEPVIPPFFAFLAPSPAFTPAQPEDLEQAGHVMTTNPYHGRELRIVGDLVPATPSQITGYVL